MPRIRHVATRSFALDLERPLATAAGEVARREGLLVRVTVEDDAGDRRTGVGEATPLPGWTEALPECRAALREAATRLRGESVATANDELDRLPPAARHGLALALSDCRARAAGVPLFAHLSRDEGGDGGDDARTARSVRVNATVGDADAAATADAARSAVADGFDCLKVKVGAGSVTDDLDRLAAVRDAVPAATVRADANGAWGRAAANRFVDGVAAHGFDVAYVEQPLSAGDLDGHAVLRRRASAEADTGVALDESMVETSVAEVLAADAADVVVLKPMALGGPDRAVAAARETVAAGVTPVVTTTVDAVVARTAAIHVAAAADAAAETAGVAPRAHGLGTAALLASDLGPDPAPVAEGAVRPPDAAGTGVSPEVFDG